MASHQRTGKRHLVAVLAYLQAIGAREIRHSSGRHWKVSATHSGQRIRVVIAATPSDRCADRAVIACLKRQQRAIDRAQEAAS
jgi:hypothetical protein